MHATHMNAQQGSLLRVLGTTMQVGHGLAKDFVHRTRIAQAQHAKRPPFMCTMGAPGIRVDLAMHIHNMRQPFIQ